MPFCLAVAQPWHLSCYCGFSITDTIKCQDPALPLVALNSAQIAVMQLDAQSHNTKQLLATVLAQYQQLPDQMLIVPYPYSKL